MQHSPVGIGWFPFGLRIMALAVPYFAKIKTTIVDQKCIFAEAKPKMESAGCINMYKVSKRVSN